jgi:magnesium-transporting ATPase (P-type)
MKFVVPKILVGVGVFFILTMIETISPGQLLGQFVFGFFCFLFLSLAVDVFIRYIYGIDSSWHSDFYTNSPKRQNIISEGYLWSAIILVLGAVGAIVSGSSIAPITWAGVPLSIVWMLLSNHPRK